MKNSKKILALFSIAALIALPIGIIFRGSADAATTFTMAEVQSHDTASDCWTVIDGKVYDLTSYIPIHPGGQGSIISLCGTDGTAAFTGKHSGSNGASLSL